MSELLQKAIEILSLYGIEAFHIYIDSLSRAERSALANEILQGMFNTIDIIIVDEVNSYIIGFSDN